MTMKIAGLVLSVIIRLLNLTLRARHVGAEKVKATPQYIFSFWHAHLLLMLHSKYSRPMTVMSSRSRDGDLAVWVYKTYLVATERGSSNKGGAEALRGLLRRAKKGSNLAFTPDGPKGPPRVVKEGLIVAAKLAGIPIIPVAFGADRKKLLHSWDRMIVPLPFSRTLYLYGDPISIPRDGDTEEWRLRVEQAMTQLADLAENHFEELWRKG